MRLPALQQTFATRFEKTPNKRTQASKTLQTATLANMSLPVYRPQHHSRNLPNDVRLCHTSGLGLARRSQVGTEADCLLRVKILKINKALGSVYPFLCAFTSDNSERAFKLELEVA